MKDKINDQQEVIDEQQYRVDSQKEVMKEMD